MSLYRSVEGFFEDYSEIRNAKYLGRLPVEWPDRKLGSEGAIERTIKQTIVLKRNMKEVKYPVSKHSPIICRCVLYPLEGRALLIGNRVRIRRTPDEQARSLSPKEGEVIAFDKDPISGTETPGLIYLRSGNAYWSEEYWRLHLIQS